MDLSVARQADTTSRARLDPSLLLLAATILFGLSVRASSPSAGGAVVLATVLAGSALWLNRVQAVVDPEPTSNRQEVRLYLAVLLFSGLGLLWWAPTWIGPTSELLERVPGLVWALVATVLYITRKRGDTRLTFAAVTVVTVSITLVIGIWNLDATEGVGLDVYLLHKGAADAMSEGQNPYTDAVEVPNGAPTAAPGDTIVGYPYPPVTAFAYALGQWSLGDPRYTGLASWLVILSLTGISAYRKRNRHQLYVLLLLASIPGWPYVLRAGWTEPLNLMLLVIAFLMWHRPTSSGLALGLGLASKQYFVVAAPLLLLHRDRGWLRRVLVAGFVVLLAVGPALVLDPTAFWNAAVEFHATTPVRTDSVNIVGLVSLLGGNWAPPGWLGPAVGIVLAVAVGTLSRDRVSFLLGMALALAASFLISSQAFANYWFLITGMVAMCLSETMTPPEPRLSERATLPVERQGTQ